MAQSVSKVMTFRATVDKVVSFLSERGFRVSQSGMKASVDYDATGKPVLVNIPMIPDNADDEFIDAIRGFIDHEVARVLFTDHTAFHNASKTNKGFANLLSIIEDTRIDKAMAERFPGSGQHLTDMWGFVGKKVTTEAVKKALVPGPKNPNPMQSVMTALMPTTLHALMGKASEDQFMKENDYWKYMQPLVDALPDDLKKRLAAPVKSTQESIELTKAVMEAIQNASEGGGGDGEDENDSDSDSDDEQEGKGKGKGKGKNDKNDKKDKNKNKNKDKSDEDGDSDDSDDSEGDDEDESEGDGKGDGDESDEDSDGDDEKEGKGKDKSDKDSDSDSEDDEGEGGKPAQPKKSSGDKAGDTKDGDKKAKGKPTVHDEKRAQRDKGKKLIAQPEQFFVKLDNVQGQLSLAMTTMAKETIAPGDYLPWSRDYDTWDYMDPKPHYADKAREEADRIDEKVRGSVGQLANHFRRLFAQKAFSVNVGGQRTGRLQSSALYKLRMDDPRVFFQREEHNATDTAVTLLVDYSGSMAGGNKIDLAMEAAYAFAQTLDRIGIQNEVLGFTTGHFAPGKQDEARRALHAAVRDAHNSIGRDYSRNDTINMLIFKTFAEQFKKVRPRFGVPLSTMRYGGETAGPVGMNANADGESLMYAAQRLMARKEPRKVLIVFSDGMPSCNGNDGHQAKCLKDTVELLDKKLKVETLGIGIMSSSVRQFYPKSIVINNVSELPSKVMTEVSKILLK